MTNELRSSKPELKALTATKWVTDCDGTTANVDLVEWNTEVLHREDGLASERFVNLEEVDVVLGYAGLGEDFGDGERRSDTSNSQ